MFLGEGGGRGPLQRDYENVPICSFTVLSRYMGFRPLISYIWVKKYLINNLKSRDHSLASTSLANK